MQNIRQNSNSYQNNLTFKVIILQGFFKELKFYIHLLKCFNKDSQALHNLFILQTMPKNLTKFTFLFFLNKCTILFKLIHLYFFKTYDFSL